MNMMLMLGLMTLVYFITLLLMCLYRYKINVKICNIVFIAADVIAYFCWNYSYFIKGWLDEGWLTFGNISPLMFTVIPLTLFMSEKVRSFAYSAIVCLNLGMFVAMLVSPEHAYLFNFDTEATFALACEAVCHMICSLFGIYLVLSNQVKPDNRTLVRSLIFMYSLITYGVILNFIFRRDHFGMDPYGNYRIYMIDIFGSFAATLIAYYLGVLVVQIFGVQTVALLDKYTARLHHHETEAAAELGDIEVETADKKI